MYFDGNIPSNPPVVVSESDTAVYGQSFTFSVAGTTLSGSDISLFSYRLVFGGSVYVPDLMSYEVIDYDGNIFDSGANPSSGSYTHESVSCEGGEISDVDYCINENDTQIGTTECGTNGILEQICTGGQWVDTDTCDESGGSSDGGTDGGTTGGDSSGTTTGGSTGGVDGGTTDGGSTGGTDGGNNWRFNNWWNI